MRITGAEALTREQLIVELEQGGKLIAYAYCISLVAVTMHRRSAVYFIPCGRGRWWKGWPYSLITLMLGWWGIPWGIVDTPRIILANFAGGEDLTAEIYEQWTED